MAKVDLNRPHRITIVMKEIVSESVVINAPTTVVWHYITDIANCPAWITSLERVQILEQKPDSLVGLRWEETRKMFGKEATETMWITRADAPHFYETQAESHGSIYTSKLSVEPAAGGCVLTMQFGATAKTVVAQLLSMIFSPMIRSSVKKMVTTDLLDIKKAAEQHARQES